MFSFSYMEIVILYFLLSLSRVAVNKVSGNVFWQFLGVMFLTVTVPFDNIFYVR